MTTENENRRSKYWMFTVNNPTALDKVQLQTAVDEIPECVFVIYQMERGTTLHAQGYVEFSKQVRRTWIKKRFNQRAWLAARKGNQKQAIAYCSKNDKTYVSGPYSYGVESSTTTSTELTSAPVVYDPSTYRGYWYNEDLTSFDANVITEYLKMIRRSSNSYAYLVWIKAQLLAGTVGEPEAMGESKDVGGG